MEPQSIKPTPFCLAKSTPIQSMLGMEWVGLGVPSMGWIMDIHGLNRPMSFTRAYYDFKILPGLITIFSY